MKIAAACVLLGLAAGPAGALPPDHRARLQPGGDGFEPGLPGKWTAVSLEPDVVEAQAFETAEVHLTAKRPGQALVLLVNRAIGQVRVWQVVVADPAASVVAEGASGAEVHKACGCDPAGRPLACRLSDQACIEALRRMFDRSELTTADLRLVYTVPGLQALLRDLQARLTQAGFGEIQLAFSGANLRVEGQVSDEAAWRRLVVTLYQGMVGRLLLEDRVQIGAASEPEQ